MNESPPRAGDPEYLRQGPVPEPQNLPVARRLLAKVQSGGLYESMIRIELEKAIEQTSVAMKVRNLTGPSEKEDRAFREAVKMLDETVRSAKKKLGEPVGEAPSAGGEVVPFKKR